MQHNQFITDVATASLEPVSNDLTVDAEGGEFDPSEAETVVLDSPWNDFFDTNEYVQFEATVAQPIVQPYFYDGSLHRFKKDKDELQQAQAQLDNIPWTVGHPEHDRITSADEIRGFWRDPYYEDGQHATLHIPANDPDGVRFAVLNDEVSVGFSGDLDWLDDSDESSRTSSSAEDAETDERDTVDAIQRNMAYDHVASVENGRCSAEDGCGLHTDDDAPEATHGVVRNFTDAMRSQTVEDPMDPPRNDTGWAEGDWVTFSADGERLHGQIAYVDNERALVKRYDEDNQRLSDASTTIATSNLREWVGPMADSCEGLCSCGCHDGPYADEAPDGIHMEDGAWYGIAPSETADDEPKYELNNCNDVKDAYNLRNNGDFDVSVETLVDRIQRASEAHDCPPEQKPWVDEDTTDSEPMSKSLTEFIDENDLNVEDVLDSLDIDASELGDVPDEPTDFYDGQPDVETLAEDFDAVGILNDEKQKYEQKVENLTDELEEYQRAEFADKAEELADLTDTFGDKDDLLDEFDEDELTIDEIDQRIELVEDVREDETTTVDSSGDGDGEGGEVTDSEPDFETTESGKLDLRKQTKN